MYICMYIYIYIHIHAHTHTYIYTYSYLPPRARPPLYVPRTPPLAPRAPLATPPPTSLRSRPDPPHATERKQGAMG